MPFSAREIRAEYDEQVARVPHPEPESSRQCRLCLKLYSNPCHGTDAKCPMLIAAAEYNKSIKANARILPTLPAEAPKQINAVVEAYPQRGPFQQFRFAELRVFNCFRCDKRTTSKLTTVYCGDWSQQLCNGCYGYLLSADLLSAKETKAVPIFKHCFHNATAAERYEILDLVLAWAENPGALALRFWHKMTQKERLDFIAESSVKALFRHTFGSHIDRMPVENNPPIKNPPAVAPAKEPEPTIDAKLARWRAMQKMDGA